MRIPFALVLATSALVSVGATAQIVRPSPPAMMGDADKDGVITLAEARAQSDARFARMDTNKDGKITAGERDAAMQLMRADRIEAGGMMPPPPPPPTGGREGGDHGSKPDGPGMRADPDGDGVVTRAEFVTRAGTQFDRMDTNRDGKLDKSERHRMRPMRGGPGGHGPDRGGDMPPAPPTGG